MRDIADLRQRQSLPLGAKVLMTQSRIREWYEHFDGNVCVSFSGGKDSTVLAHLVHELYPEVPLVFCNTGLEYPEIQSFARKMGAEFVYPKMNFSEVISNYGYPIISKENAEAIHYARKICNIGGVRQKKENARNLQEDEPPGLRIPQKIMGGVGSIQTAGGHHRDAEQIRSIYQGRTGWRRATLTGKPLPSRKGNVAGVVGHNGEDEPLPG